MLNRPSTVDRAALSQIPQQPVKDEVTLSPSMEEIRKAIFQTNTGRASGKDGIPAEIYKVAGPNTLEAFQDILPRRWDEQQMPDGFRDALIVALYKNKGSMADCGNCRTISLLSIAGKIFVRVVLNRLIAVSEKNLPEAQCGQEEARWT